MAEEGIDISAHQSKHINELKDIAFDLVITVCDHARENCPVFPGKTRVIHAGFYDPPYPVREASTKEALVHYRRVRDEIKRFVETLPDQLSMTEGH